MWQRNWSRKKTEVIINQKQGNHFLSVLPTDNLSFYSFKILGQIPQIPQIPDPDRIQAWRNLIKSPWCHKITALILVHHLPSLSELRTSAAGTPETEAGDGRCLAEFPKWRPGPTQKASTSKTDSQKAGPLHPEPFQQRGKVMYLPGPPSTEGNSKHTANL